MGQNIFEALRTKKQNLKQLVNQAHSFGWIDKGRCDEIISKLENDTLTIGVIGQMKCGKSTFLNAFVFEDDVLPAATTPMTAALSVITYGEEKRVVAEFYNQEEWEEQKIQAARSLEDALGNSLEESKIKAAKELVEKSFKLRGTINNYLGGSQEDKFENLIEYVGADGKYISITKSVTIYYPKEYLKGVEIVDTPGFNDPIVSREERTKAFLGKADVVLMMLYAGRPFDAIDRDILFQNVRSCGIGKVLIGINKYDIPYENGDGEDQIRTYVECEIKKASKEYKDDTLADLLKDTTPILLSAEMALLSELPMSRVAADDAYNTAWKRYCSNFEISSQQQMRELSHINKLTSAIKQLVEKEKGEILFAKPLNAILASGNSKASKIEKALRDYESQITNLNTPNDELEEKLLKLKKVEKRLSKKINILGDDIESEFKQIVRKGANELEDAVDASCNKMHSIIDAKGRFEDSENLRPSLSKEYNNLNTRTFKRLVERLAKEAKGKVKSSITDFIREAEETLRKIPDFESADFIKKVNSKIQIEIDNKDIFTVDKDDDDNYGWGVLALAFIGDFLNGATFGVFSKIGTVLAHNEYKRDLHNYINTINSDFDPKPFLDTIYIQKDNVINSVKKEFLEELINPFQEQIEEILSEKTGKEEKLEEAKSKLLVLKKEKEEMEKQMTEINGFRMAL